MLGNESHGKSTLLERLIGFPIFPRDKGLCTRCPIRVHLRRGEFKIPTIEIRNRSNNTTVPNSRVACALENMSETCKSMMDNLCPPDKGKSIDPKHELFIDVQVKYCSNLDILDLPGFVTANSQHNTQDLMTETRSMAADIIKKENAFSIFLLVDSCTTPANQSVASGLVQQFGIQDKTLGIFTKCDVFRSEDGDDEKDLMDIISSKSPGSIHLTFGWLGSSSYVTKAQEKETKKSHLR